MSLYIGATHVEAYNPVRSFTSTTRPSDTQVTELILEAEADVTGVMVAAGLTTPVPSSATGQGFKMVQSACAKCAAALVEQVAPNADAKRIEHYVKMCDEAKKAIAAGGLAGFDDVDSVSGGGGRGRSGFEGASPAYFTRDMQL